MTKGTPLSPKYHPPAASEPVAHLRRRSLMPEPNLIGNSPQRHPFKQPTYPSRSPVLVSLTFRMVNTVQRQTSLSSTQYWISPSPHPGPPLISHFPWLRPRSR